jgi:hypothetical protein
MKMLCEEYRQGQSVNGHKDPMVSIVGVFMRYNTGAHRKN